MMSQMERPDRVTMRYEIWPYLVLVEGPVNKIGKLLLDLYGNRKIDRARWTVDHTMRSRRTYADHLQRSGLASRRQGIALKDPAVLAAVQQQCAALGLDCHLFGKGTLKR